MSIKEAQIQLAAFGDKSDRSVNANSTWDEPIDRDMQLHQHINNNQSPLGFMHH